MLLVLYRKTGGLSFVVLIGFAVDALAGVSSVKGTGSFREWIMDLVCALIAGRKE